MHKYNHYWLLAIVVSFMLFAIGDTTAQTSGTPQGHLVSVEWLKNARENVLLLDTSPAQEYASKHIPGAVSVNVYAFAGRDLPVPQLEQMMQTWGISAGKKIVIYDQGASILATTLFFELHYHGVPVDDLLILNGGVAKWEAVGFIPKP